MTFYDLAAPVYGIWAALVESRAHRWAREAIREHPGRNLLEIAVGTGAEFGKLLGDSRFRTCVGIDLSIGMLRRARKRLRRAGQTKTVLLCRADARKLPFRTASFDSILNCYMIDLLPEQDIPVVISEFRRVVRADGRLVLVTMAEQRRARQRMWMALYRFAPILVGGCRPIDAASRLQQSGWVIEREEPVCQIGFRSSLIVARPPTVRTGA